MFIESLFADVRYALRGFRASPLFAGGVAGTIGLGLGILGSAFTLVNGYLFKPIDLPDPYALHAVAWETPGTGEHRFSRTDVDALRDRNPVFVDVAAGDVLIAIQDGQRISGRAVSGNYHRLLGARAEWGRTLGPEDTAARGGGAVVVLSHEAWRSRFAADPTLIGRPITLGGRQMDLVGVMTPGSALPGDEAVDFWVPLTAAAAFGAPDPWRQGATPSLFAIARLRPGVTAAQARAWLDVWLRRRLPPAAQASETPTGVMRSLATRIPLNPQTAVMFSLMLAAFGLVLLVACANVTNLMLARGIGRRPEISLRLSLGASRARVVRQLVVESLVLAVPAAGIGLAMTFAAARAFPLVILASYPEGLPPAAPFLAPLDPDVRVLAVLVVAAILAAVVVGLSPAVQVTRSRFGHGKGTVGADAGLSRLRTALVGLQVGACIVFLVGAVGLVVESRRMASPATGLDYERVVDLRIEAGRRAEVSARLRSDPAIAGVAAAWRTPMAGPLPTMPVVPVPGAASRPVGFMAVSPEFFPLFGVPIVGGRAFSAAEAEQGLPVAVVSRATAHALWPGQDPVGQSLEIGPSGAAQERHPAQGRVRVIGVAADVINGAIIDGPDATCVYLPTTIAAPGDLVLLVRARTDAAAVSRATATLLNAPARNATAASGVAFEANPLRVMLGLQVWAFQAFSATAALLGGVGLLLALSGTYAVVAFVTAQRQREFGIRMALGATTGRIVRDVLGGALRIAGAGTLGGLVVALVLARASDAAIDIVPTFGVGPYALATAIVLLATMAAALGPSRRAARIEPSAALRAE